MAACLETITLILPAAESNWKRRDQLLCTPAPLVAVGLALPCSCSFAMVPPNLQASITLDTRTCCLAWPSFSFPSMHGWGGYRQAWSAKLRVQQAQLARQLERHSSFFENLAACSCISALNAVVRMLLLPVCSL